MKVAAAFVTSAAGIEGFPREGLPELAVIGRSNVGKSSLINALVRQKVARTSATPGKTRLANFYRVSRPGLPAFHLVDLPGYGYARAARDLRARHGSARAGRAAAAEAFDVLVDGFFAPTRRVGGRIAVRGCLLLVDSRHPGMEADAEAWTWLGTRTAPRHVIATKVDKLTQAERRRHLTELERNYRGPVLAVSAATGEGLNELWTLIARLLEQPPPETAPQPPPPSR